MCIIIKLNDEDLPMLKCGSCDVIFYIYWHNNGFTTGIEYCPFCGEEVDTIKDET